MLRVPTWILSFFGLLFGLYQAVLGVLWIRQNDRPEVVIAALVAYLIVLFSSVVVGKSRLMPIGLAWLDLAVSAAIPLAINTQLHPSHLGDYSTWYVLGVGTILGIIAVRGRRSVAWIGFAILVTEIYLWGGLGALASTGLPGVLSLLVTGHAVSLGVGRAVNQAQQLNEFAEKSAAETAAVEAASQIRSVLIERTLRNALPSLTLIAALGGKLNDSQKREALLLEAGLRDEIRGEALLSDTMRSAIKAARMRGVEVLVLDEGGLDCLDEPEREALLDQAAQSIAMVSKGRLTIRSPQSESWRITIAAVTPGSAQPDLWIKLG